MSRPLPYLVLLSACGGGEGGAPIAIIAADAQTGAFPFDVQLDASASSGRDLAYEWDFGDGQGATGESAAHTYLGSGTWTVQLTVRDKDGVAATDTLDLVVDRPSCPQGGAGETLGSLGDPVLDEVSGLAASRQNPGVLWVHNDARNERALYAIDTAGNMLGEFVAAIDEGDWEDVAIGELDGDPVIFVGSIGDNQLDRDEIAVHVFDEPQVALGGRTDGSLSGFQISIAYPGGAHHDAETLFADPQTGDLYIVTKSEGPSSVFRVTAPLQAGTANVNEVATLDFDADPLSGRRTTGGSMSPLGDLIAIRTHSRTAYLWRRDGSKKLWKAFDTEPCPIELPSEAQGESIGFAPDGNGLFSMSEEAGSDVHYTPLE